MINSFRGYDKIELELVYYWPISSMHDFYEKAFLVTVDGKHFLLPTMNEKDLGTVIRSEHHAKNFLDSIKDEKL